MSRSRTRSRSRSPELEPAKNEPFPQHCCFPNQYRYRYNYIKYLFSSMRNRYNKCEAH